MPQDSTVYIIDDDASVRDAMAWLLRSRRLLSEAYESAEAFEAARGRAEPAAPGCILLDVRMPGQSGLALFERLSERGLTPERIARLQSRLSHPDTTDTAAYGGAVNSRIQARREAAMVRDVETGAELHRLTREAAHLRTLLGVTA